MDPQREYGRVAVEVSSPEQLADYLDRTGPQWRVAYWNDHLEDDFPALCTAAYRLGQLTFVVDEADWFTSPSYIDPEFERLVKYGRHAGVTVITACRMPTSEMHPLPRKLAWFFYCFGVDEPSDVDYLRKRFGQTFADAVVMLPELRCYRVNVLDRRQPAMLLEVDPKLLVIREVEQLAILELPAVEEPDEADNHVGT